MNKKIFTALGMIMLLMSSWNYGQKELKKAEIQSLSGVYDKAIKNFITHIDNHPNDYEAMAKLAETYRANGNLVQAHLWYQSIPESNEISAEVYKKHGDLLKNMFRYDDALTKYMIYAERQPEEAKRLIKGIEYAKSEMSAKPKYDSENLPFNSSVSDFGLSFYKGLPLYSSFRNDIMMTEIDREMNSENFVHKTLLFNPVKNRQSFIKNHKGKINQTGPIVFSEDGKKCVFVEGDIMDNYNIINGIKSSVLHVAEVDDMGNITSSVPFPYNEIGSSIISAHLAYDGTVLYFSSNRQGGFGGYDIYVSYYNSGKWSLPENLGGQINTSGNEITPFYEDGHLYFASDEHIGLGGYDIFKSNVKNGLWLAPINLGHGINTPADEYFPSIHMSGELFYTSNKLGGLGGNDIYKAIEIEEELPMLAEMDMELDLEAPEVVSLEKMEQEIERHSVSPSQLSDVKEVAFRLPEFDTKKVGLAVEDGMELFGAHRVALDELILENTEVFFIQLASISASKPNFEKFKSLLKYGNIYKTRTNSAIKVRLGYYSDRKEAEDILRKVRDNGYRDAFIALEMLNTSQIELVLAGKDSESFTDRGNFNTKNDDVKKEYYETNKYKVRLASYEDPIWFDVNKIKDLGRVEQWTKGNWTIFILAGFNSLDEAKKAQIQASNRGFKTAEVVVDNGGILERLKQN